MPTNITIKNTNQINQLKVTQETLEDHPKTKGVKIWSPKADAYLKPSEQTDVWVGGPRRVIIQEMPT